MASGQMQQDNGDIGTVVLALEMKYEVGFINTNLISFLREFQKLTQK